MDEPNRSTPVRTKLSTMLICIISGIIFGILIPLGIRLLTYKPEKVHYHANFALYINGERVQFRGPQFYEEKEMCAVNSEETSNPSERAHMHDNINDVVHVESRGVTWGHFLLNLGWTLGPTFISSSDGKIYENQDGSKLHIILNSQDYTDMGSVANRVIKDEDKLLVSYGSIPDEVLQKQYKEIPSTARQYDLKPDPASCSGSKTASFRERIKHLF